MGSVQIAFGWVTKVPRSKTLVFSVIIILKKEKGVFYFFCTAVVFNLHLGPLCHPAGHVPLAIVKPCQKANCIG